jgi:hypothetical protein
MKYGNESQNNHNSPATFFLFMHLLYGAMKINMHEHQLLQDRKNSVVITNSELACELLEK